MKNRIWLISAGLIMFSAALAFSSGQDDKDDRDYDYDKGFGRGCGDFRGGYGGRGYGGRGYGGRGYGGRGYDERELMRFMDRNDPTALSGKFSMVEDSYPALIDSEGKAFYLILGGYVKEDSRPAEGASIEIEGYKTPISPVHYLVVSAKVDGMEIVESRRGWWSER